MWAGVPKPALSHQRKALLCLPFSISIPDSPYISSVSIPLVPLLSFLPSPPTSLMFFFCPVSSPLPFPVPPLFPPLSLLSFCLSSLFPPLSHILCPVSSLPCRLMAEAPARIMSWMITVRHVWYTVHSLSPVSCFINTSHMHIYITFPSALLSQANCEENLIMVCWFLLKNSWHSDIWLALLSHCMKVLCLIPRPCGAFLCSGVECSPHAWMDFPLVAPVVLINS